MDDGGEYQIGVSSFDEDAVFELDASVYAPVAASVAQANWINSFLKANGPKDEGEALSTVVLHGFSNMKVNDRAEIRSGSIAGYAVNVGVDSYVRDNIWGGLTVALRERAEVRGDIASYFRPGKQNGVQSGNWRYSVGHMPPVETLIQCYEAATLPGGENMTIERGNSRTLRPGSYGSVTVRAGATLLLDGTGTYSFTSLDIDGGTLNTSVRANDLGTMRIFVSDGLRLNGFHVSNAPPNRYMLGRTGAGSISINQTLNMTVIAPRSAIVLEPGKTWNGSGMALNIEIHQGAYVHHRPFLAPYYSTLCP